uniref:Uncharacterized protein n=1 Tax=Triticum urartu TaxID=4572 RepID=A0A8R7TXG8_TRIUA
MHARIGRIRKGVGGGGGGGGEGGIAGAIEMDSLPLSEQEQASVWPRSPLSRCLCSAVAVPPPARLLANRHLLGLAAASAFETFLFSPSRPPRGRGERCSWVGPGRAVTRELVWLFSPKRYTSPN